MIFFLMQIQIQCGFLSWLQVLDQVRVFFNLFLVIREICPLFLHLLLKSMEDVLFSCHFPLQIRNRIVPKFWCDQLAIFLYEKEVPWGAFLMFMYLCWATQLSRGPFPSLDSESQKSSKHNWQNKSLSLRNFCQ